MIFNTLGFGRIQLLCKSPEEAEATMLEFIDKLGGAWIRSHIDTSENEGSYYIDIRASDVWCDNYFFNDAFNSIKHLVASGIVEIRDEDGVHWRYRFNQHKGDWDIEEGTVVYNAEDALAYVQSEYHRLEQQLSKKEA